MEITDLLAENEAAMVRLDNWLEQTRDRGQDRLSNILQTVRSEVEFEIRLAEENGLLNGYKGGVWERGDPGTDGHSP